jgi:hypothetical protein
MLICEMITTVDTAKYDGSPYGMWKAGRLLDRTTV